MDAEFRAARTEHRVRLLRPSSESSRRLPADWKMCHVRGCACSSSDGWFVHGPEHICPEHLSRASASARQLFTSARNRLEQIERSRASEPVFEGIVARGRYLQFCGLIEAAHDHVDWAWERVKREIDSPDGDRGRPGGGRACELPQAPPTTPAFCAPCPHPRPSENCPALIRRGATTFALERRRRQCDENPPAAPIHTLGRVSLAEGLESSRSVQAATAGGGVISISGRNSRNGR